MNLSTSHKSAKNEAYWHNLVSADTGEYKTGVIKNLITRHLTTPVKNILDIGCGTCEIAFGYAEKFPQARVTCLDYDANVIDRLRLKYPSPDITWLVQDIFDLGEAGQKYDLVFLLDMLHEVYSFFGRPDRKLESPVDHSLGLKYVCDALRNVAEATAPSGSIVITDNVLTEDNALTRLRLKRPSITAAVRKLLNEYPTRRLNIRFIQDDIIELPSQDLCILLTQYNKISQDRLDRWNVERMEIHQYMSMSQYANLFNDLGFDLHAVTGTPAQASAEQSADFELISGRNALPDKRITLLAIKR